MNSPEMTLADAESILAQVLEHPNLTLSFSNHVIAREALRKLAEAARRRAAEDRGLKMADGAGQRTGDQE